MDDHLEGLRARGGLEGFCFPLAKVGKYLENGAEDSVWVFSQAIIARADHVVE